MFLLALRHIVLLTINVCQCTVKGFQGCHEGSEHGRPAGGTPDRIEAGSVKVAIRGSPLPRRLSACRARTHRSCRWTAGQPAALGAPAAPETRWTLQGEGGAMCGAWTRTHQHLHRTLARPGLATQRKGMRPSLSDK